MNTPNPGARRAFLRSAVRYLIAGALAAGTAALAMRRETCDRAFICRGCPELDGCGLPQALSLKQASGK